MSGKEGLALVYGYLKGQTAAAKFQNGELYYYATHDPLTGLHNRRYAEEFLEREKKTVERHIPLSIILFDLDKFKEINDGYGHPVGDEVLKETAIRSLVSLRNIDLLSRFGGDEFSVILPDTPLDKAIIAAERIRQNIAGEPIVTSSGILRVTSSLGVVQYRQGMNLLHAADQAMYRAKYGNEYHKGRNAVAFLNSSGEFLLHK